jgi:ribonuclease R
MVRMSDMTDDFYEFDEKKYRIIGRRSKKVYTLGDKIVVKVKRTDIDKRLIDLVVMNPKKEGTPSADFNDEDFS